MENPEIDNITDAQSAGTTNSETGSMDTHQSTQIKDDEQSMTTVSVEESTDFEGTEIPKEMDIRTLVGERKDDAKEPEKTILREDAREMVLQQEEVDTLTENIEISEKSAESVSADNSGINTAQDSMEGIADMKFAFIPYNTDMEHLKLPEYGRKIQELIGYCKSIPDKEERTACAYAIADVMVRLQPNASKDKVDRKKIWDHLNIMAGFELDIDFPVEVISSQELNPKPHRIDYNRRPIRYRHYGRTLELMVERASEMEDSQEKDHLIMLIANQMKKQLLAHNKEGVSDAKVLKDLAEYSHGRIVLDPRTYPLHEYNEVNNRQPQGKKKRKK